MPAAGFPCLCLLQLLCLFSLWQRCRLPPESARWLAPTCAERRSWRRRGRARAWCGGECRRQTPGCTCPPRARTRKGSAGSRRPRFGAGVPAASAASLAHWLLRGARRARGVVVRVGVGVGPHRPANGSAGKPRWGGPRSPTWCMRVHGRSAPERSMYAARRLIKPCIKRTALLLGPCPWLP